MQKPGTLLQLLCAITTLIIGLPTEDQTSNDFPTSDRLAGVPGFSGDTSTAEGAYQAYRTIVSSGTDQTQANMWLLKAANGGLHVAQNTLGLAIQKQRVTGTITEAADWFCLAARQNHAPAMNNLGMLLAQGHAPSYGLVAAATSASFHNGEVDVNTPFAGRQTNAPSVAVHVSTTSDANGLETSTFWFRAAANVRLNTI
jgi:TPR repeat protein